METTMLGFNQAGMNQARKVFIKLVLWIFGIFVVFTILGMVFL